MELCGHVLITVMRKHSQAAFQYAHMVARPRSSSAAMPRCRSGRAGMMMSAAEMPSAGTTR